MPTVAPGDSIYNHVVNIFGYAKQLAHTALDHARWPGSYTFNDWTEAWLDYTDRAYDPVGGGYTWTFSKWLDAAGMSSGFERRFPRTIASVASSGTLGQRAYLGTQDSETTHSANNHSRDIYEHDGSTWGYSADQVADVDVITYFMHPNEASTNLWWGDYLGVWTFRDLADAISAIQAFPIRSVSYAAEADDFSAALYPYDDDLAPVVVEKTGSESRTGTTADAALQAAKSASAAEFSTKNTTGVHYEALAKSEVRWVRTSPPYEASVLYQTRKMPVNVRASDSSPRTFDIRFVAQKVDEPDAFIAVDFEDYGQGIVEGSGNLAYSATPPANDANGECSRLFDIGPDPITSLPELTAAHEAAVLADTSVRHKQGWDMAYVIGIVQYTFSYV